MSFLNFFFFSIRKTIRFPIGLQMIRRQLNRSIWINWVFFAAISTHSSELVLAPFILNGVKCYVKVNLILATSKDLARIKGRQELKLSLTAPHAATAVPARSSSGATTPVAVGAVPGRAWLRIHGLGLATPALFVVTREVYPRTSPPSMCPSASTSVSVIPHIFSPSTYFVLFISSGTAAA
jgi:hypothetical protein